jgi:hypothetical protein
MLFVATGGTAELPRRDRRKEVLGLRGRKRYPTDRVPGQGERADLLFFTTRGSGELWPGAEADAARHTITAADNASHPAADASATDLTSHPFTFPQQETVTRQPE